MDYEKQLFIKSKVSAPKNFTSKTMEYIKAKELDTEKKSTAKIEYSFFKLGQICVAAALLMIILNISPISKIVYSQDYNNQPIQQESIVKKTVNKLDSFFDEITETIDFKFFESK